MLKPFEKIHTSVIKNKWWIVIVIISGGILLFLKLNNVPTDEENARLILSSISTSLVAVLALIFAILTFSVQMTQKYNAMNVFFERSAKILMLIFSITIILPLFMLKFKYYFPSLMISLFVFCILSLYPFIRNINFKLKYIVGIQNLKEQISEAIDSKSDASAANKIKDLCLLGQNTIEEDQTERTDYIINSLHDFSQLATDEKLEATLEAIETGVIDLIVLAINKRNEKIIEKMLEILIFVIYPIQHERIIEKSQLRLKEIGMKIMERELDENLLTNIGNKLFCILDSENELFTTKENCIIYLTELYFKSYQEKERYKEASKNLMRYLLYSCVYIFQWYEKTIQLREIPKSSRKIYDLLCYSREQVFLIEKKIGQTEFEKLFKEAESYRFMPGYSRGLKEFRQFYDEYNKNINI